MDALPRGVLCQLLVDYGPALLNEPARVNALLADLCGPYHCERFLLIHALLERIPVELRAQPHGGTPLELRLSRRLQNRYCFSAEAAHWAVESWSTAIKVGEVPTPKSAGLKAAPTQFGTLEEKYKTAKDQLNEVQRDVDRAIVQGKIARAKMETAQSQFDTSVEQYMTAKGSVEQGTGERGEDHCSTGN